MRHPHMPCHAVDRCNAREINCPVRQLHSHIYRHTSISSDFHASCRSLTSVHCISPGPPITCRLGTCRSVPWSEYRVSCRSLGGIHSLVFPNHLQLQNRQPQRKVDSRFSSKFDRLRGRSSQAEGFGGDTLRIMYHLLHLMIRPQPLTQL